ncbi:hypothetical protein LTR12_009403 [Friedmanniomyces endolithicus]|nr:hypothetical protein LTR74_001111 [Friedmanniomyces endolithicus]KAK1816154.1 hypothetical protein LTR12_009403 [Friedmanniomyces endolithicus]
MGPGQSRSERVGDVRATSEIVPEAAHDHPSAGSDYERPLWTAVRLSGAQAVCYPKPRAPPVQSCVPQKRHLDHDELSNFFDTRRSPPRLNRTFQRDHVALEEVRPHDMYHVSPERNRRDSLDDRQSVFGDHSSRRVYRQYTPSPPPLRRPSHGIYNQRKPSSSLDGPIALSPVQSRPSLSSPFQKQGRDILSPEHDQSAYSEPAAYGNLTRKAKKLPIVESASRGGNDDFGRSSKGSMSAGSPSRTQVPAKIDFNGIKSVPTGPKPGAAAGSGRFSIGDLPEVDAAVKAGPHILIPGGCVPPDPAILRHLRGFLGSPQPEGIFVDDGGYYLTWPDTEQGHLDLAKCAARKDGLLLFGMYTVEAIAFHEGVPLGKHIDGAEVALQKKPQSNTSPPVPPSATTQPQAPSARSMLRDLDPAVGLTPHIFVHGMPLQANMIKHLTGFLGSPRPEAVLVDKMGYYVVWPDTPKGHEHLQKCIERKNGTQIFSRYTLHMTAFYKGLPYTEGVAIAGSALPVEARSVAPPNVLLLEGIEPHKTPSKAALTEASCKTNIATAGHSVRSSSPRRVPLRPDGDNASSISGRTASSDASASSALKCHVCKVASTLDVDALAQCSTCSRRYHRRCHPFPAVPLDNESKDSWRCRRCAKKEAEARVSHPIVSIGSYAELETPSTLVEELDGPPAKRARVDKPQITPGTVVGSAIRGNPFRERAPINDVHAASSDQAVALGAAAGVLAKANGILGRDAELLSEAAGKASGKDAHLDEADMLVEESFAAFEAPRSEVPKAAIKPVLTRRKIVRSPTKDMVDAGKVNEISTAFPPPKISLTGNDPEKTKGGGEATHLGKSNQSLTPTAPTTSLGGVTSERAGSLSVKTAKVPTSADAIFGAATPSSPSRPRLTAADQAKLNKSAAKENTELEVPETPELAEAPSLALPPTTTNDQGTKPPVTHGIGSTSPVDSVMQTEQGIRVVMPATGLAKRTKQRTKVVKCYQCRKLAVVDAAVGRGLCPDCKKAGSAKAATKGGDSHVAVITTGEVINATGAKKNNRSAESAGTLVRTPVAGTGDGEIAGDASPRRNDLDISPRTEDDPPRSRHAEDQAVASTVKKAATAVSGRQPSDGKPKHKVTVLRTPNLGARAVRGPGEADRPDEAARGALKLGSGILDKSSDDIGVTPPSKPRVRDRRASSLQALEAPASFTDLTDQSATPPPPSLMDDDPESRRALRPATRSENASPTPAEASAQSKPNESSSGKRRRQEGEVFNSGDVLAPRRYSKYDELIGFALIDAPGHRLQVRSIVIWIAENVPGYYKDGVPWPNRISMALSAATGKGKNLYIKEEMREDDANLNGKGSWWRLRPEVVSSVKRWDPEHWRPAGPPRGRSKATVEDESSDDSDGDEPPIRPRRAGRLAVVAQQKKLDGASESVENAAEAQRESTRDLGRKIEDKVRGKEAGPRVEEAPDTEDEEDMEDVFPGDGSRQASNAPIPDEVPLTGMSRTKPTYLQPQAAPMNLPAIASDLGSDVDMEDVSPAENHFVAGGRLEPASREYQGSLLKTGRLRVDIDPLRIDPYQNGDSSLAQLIKLEAGNVAYTAISLFDEWPEHDPKNQHDKYAKMGEITKRLTRKQLFAKPAMYSRLSSNVAATPHQSFNSNTTDNCDSEGHTTGPSGERRTQSPKKLSFQNILFPLDERVRKFGSLEDFFEMPDNAIPMYRSKELAFRDGTRDKHGRLPRAGVYYHPGYE